MSFDAVGDEARFSEKLAIASAPVEFVLQRTDDQRLEASRRRTFRGDDWGRENVLWMRNS